MDEPCFPQWPDLLFDVKMKIIPMLDYKTRRLLRSCSSEDMKLVDRFPIRKEMMMECRLCEETGKWFCEYSCGQNSSHAFKKCFDTCEEAYEHMKKVINTVETVTELYIDSKLGSKIVIRDGKKLVNVKEVNWLYSGAENNGAEFEHLLNQINLFGLKELSLIQNETEPIIDPLLNESCFELEKTILNLDYFFCGHVINDEQLLGIRANQIALLKSNLITSSGFVKFIQKKVLAPPILSSCSEGGCSLHLCNISSDLQLYLFGEMLNIFDSPDVDLIFNMHGTDLKMHFKFRGFGGPYDLHNIEMDICELDELRYDAYEWNNEALEAYPTLHNFIDAISHVLPPGFPLMRDLRN